MVLKEYATMGLAGLMEPMEVDDPVSGLSREIREVEQQIAVVEGQITGVERQIKPVKAVLTVANIDSLLDRFWHELRKPNLQYPKADAFLVDFPTCKVPLPKDPTDECPHLLWHALDQPFETSKRIIEVTNEARPTLTVLFNVSGSGKTRTLYEIALAQRGLFFVGVSDTDTGAEGSGDLKLVTSKLLELYPTGDIPEVSAAICLKALLISRFYLLGQVEKMGDLTGQAWLFKQDLERIEGTSGSMLAVARGISATLKRRASVMVFHGFGGFTTVEDFKLYAGKLLRSVDGIDMQRVCDLYKGRYRFFVTALEHFIGSKRPLEQATEFLIGFFEKMCTSSKISRSQEGVPNKSELEVYMDKTVLRDVELFFERTRNAAAVKELKVILYHQMFGSISTVLNINNPSLSLVEFGQFKAKGQGSDMTVTVGLESERLVGFMVDALDGKAPVDFVSRFLQNRFVKLSNNNFEVPAIYLEKAKVVMACLATGVVTKMCGQLPSGGRLSPLKRQNVEGVIQPLCGVIGGNNVSLYLKEWLIDSVWVLKVNV
ncbi:hypothetical protein SELMODRAFT_427612 [Selaginella moellendorffii]|uniref:Uncharacterized protein n=1 Tax=Selaginella moellendorffii TaxID=88036 RepID=D8T061_SELML|nr:hypothetical protein SELMODRAFT_427612 [Selaginella moellendorffii]